MVHTIPVGHTVVNGFMRSMFRLALCSENCGTIATRFFEVICVSIRHDYAADSRNMVRWQEGNAV